MSKHELLVMAENIQHELVTHRRHLHQNPEIGFDLPNTVAYVEKTLIEMGLELKRLEKQDL